MIDEVLRGCANEDAMGEYSGREATDMILEKLWLTTVK